jgi:hypothetical protein
MNFNHYFYLNVHTNLQNNKGKRLKIAKQLKILKNLVRTGFKPGSALEVQVQGSPFLKNAVQVQVRVQAKMA